MSSVEGSDFSISFGMWFCIIIFLKLIVDKIIQEFCVARGPNYYFSSY